MCFFLEQGNRIAVHCHAGLGRTGLAIACCLVFQGTHSAADAVTLVRRMRPGSLQTRGQDHFVHAFERHVEHLRMQFRLAPVKRKVRLAAIFQTTSSSPRQATAVGKQDNRSRLRDTSSRILKLEATNGLPGSSRALEVSETDSPAIIPSRAAPPPRSNTPTASGRTEALSLRQGDSTLRWKLSPPSSFRSSQSRVDQGTQGQGSDSREASAPDADWELNDSDSGMAEMLDSFSMTSLAARKVIGVVG